MKTERIWIERRIVKREPIERKGKVVGQLETMEVCGHTNSTGDMTDDEKWVPCLTCMAEAQKAMIPNPSHWPLKEPSSIGHTSAEWHMTRAMVPNPSARDWTEDFSRENGNYGCLCVICNQTFNGHKRRHVCKECVEKAPSASTEGAR